MKSLLSFALVLIAASTALAGSDTLHCSTASGYTLSGSLWNSDGTLTSVSVEKGKKLSVKTTSVISDSVQVLLDQTRADIVKAIADAKVELKNSKYHSDILIVAPLAKPAYARKEEYSACRDFGDMEYTQKAALITVALRWNEKIKDSEVVVTREPLALTCLYSYATAPGGGADCEQ